MVMQPRLIVYSSLFPSDVSPTAGTFIRERMFRVAKRVPIVVVAPQAWSPFDAAIRRWRPGFRTQAALRETIDGIDVFRPRWLSLPGVGKRFDGWLMAACTERCVRKIHAEFHATAIDAHFLYPDGWAATRIARRLRLPVTVTIRGSKDQWLIGSPRERGLREAMERATKLFAVSQSLARNVAHALGVAVEKVQVVGNGVDTDCFAPVDRLEARRRLGLAADAKVLIGVANLIESKGFQRVIPLLPALRALYPGLVYLIVGADGAQGKLRPWLEALAREFGVSDIVRFCGAHPQKELRWFYGAADLFVLATEFEGWANVYLEAMACGLPVVTTRVGGNEEVVREPDTGVLVDWWNPQRFADAIEHGLEHPWDRGAIVDYARANAWDQRIDQLVREFTRISGAVPCDRPLSAGS